jgi:hypothetical protein
MKKFVIFLFLFFSFFCYSQDISVIHFNYKWNQQNDFKELADIKRAKVSKAFVEDQPDNFKSSFKAVPVIIIFKNGKPVKRVEADLSMKIKARLEDIQELVDRYQ